jgi:hypothetical protein
MIDGKTIKFELLNFDHWKQLVNLSWGVTVDIDNAEIKKKTRYGKTTTIHWARWPKALKTKF